MIESRSLLPSPSCVPAFAPVPRKNTVTHGWTPAKQRAFVEALAASGSVRLATEAVGMSHCGVYKLRHAPEAEDLARAWDAAVELGARRVRDVLIDQAIHGIPERVLIGKDTVALRRRFNHRTMIRVLQHHLPDLYPSGSTTHRRGWREPPKPSFDDVSDKLLPQLDALKRSRMRAIAADPAKRAAYELLNGPTKWS